MSRPTEAGRAALRVMASGRDDRSGDSTMRTASLQILLLGKGPMKHNGAMSGGSRKRADVPLNGRSVKRFDCVRTTPEAAPGRKADPALP